jgi:hypothetical protein
MHDVNVDLLFKDFEQKIQIAKNITKKIKFQLPEENKNNKENSIWKNALKFRIKQGIKMIQKS